MMGGSTNNTLVNRGQQPQPAHRTTSSKNLTRDREPKQGDQADPPTSSGTTRQEQLGGDTPQETLPQEAIPEDNTFKQGWVYIGDGEWVAPTEFHQHPLTLEGPEIQRDPHWIHQWRIITDEDLRRHEQVLEQGYPNRWEARIPLKNTWNLELFESLLTNYHDIEVIEWMRYGWPSGRLPNLPSPTRTNKNHTGATEHIGALKKYITKELSKQAVMGPYEKIPFSNKSTVGISLLSTRPKKDSMDRRVILDLSFPMGHSVNDGMEKDNYLGFQAKLSFPRIDDFAIRIHQLGKGCLMFKIDLSRYFRQLPLDPGDYSLIGYSIEGKIYFDKVLPMGMRTAPYIAQSQML